jgi:hypothetical protein
MPPQTQAAPDFIPDAAAPDFIPDTASLQADIRAKGKRILARNQNKTQFEQDNEPPDPVRGAYDPMYAYDRTRSMAKSAARDWDTAAKAYSDKGEGSAFPRAMADTARFADSALSPKNLAIAGATAVVPEITLPILAYQGGKEALTPRQANETDADALQRRLYGASQVAGAGAGVRGVMTGDLPMGTPKIVPPMVRGTAKMTNAVLEKAPGLAGIAAGEMIGSQVGHPHIGGSIGYAIGKELLPKMRVPGENFGLKSAPEISAPLEGEYVDTPPAPEVIAPRQLKMSEVNAEHAPQPAPYRRGPGEVPPDEIPANAAPGEENVLAGKQGVLVRPMLRLKRAPSRISDTIDDAGLKQDMQADLDAEGRDVARERLARNTVEQKPKWLRAAESKADQLVQDAIAKNANPLRGLKRPDVAPPTKAAPEGPPGVVPEPSQDLTPLLEESVKAGEKETQTLNTHQIP